MKHKFENTYCIDTSALITMHRYYPLRMLPDLWNQVENLFKRGRIASHEFVFDEIVPKSGNKDDLAILISKYKPNFTSISKRQAQLVPQIISFFPNLIDPRGVVA